MASSDSVEQQRPNEEEILESVFSVLVAPPPSAPSSETVRLESVSPADTVVTLRQLLAEFPALTCYTCYHLEAKSLTDDTWQPLNDYVELGDYETVTDGVTLRIVLDKYDARKVRAHVRRFREVLTNPPIPPLAIEPESPSDAVVSKDKEPTATEGEEMQDKKLKEVSEQQLKRLREIHYKLEGIEVPVVPDLADFYSFPGASPAAQEEAEQVESATKGKDQKKKKKKGKKNSQQHKEQQQLIEADEQKKQEQSVNAKLPVCLKSIVFSGYNPPPGPRKLAGDLMYLEVVVAGENTPYHITAHVDGFFMNRSTAIEFDPRPDTTDAGYTHLLVDLLSSVSSKFRDSYAALLAKVASLAEEGPSSIEWMVAAGSYVGVKLPWNAPAGITTEKHAYDLNRAEDELCASYGMDERGVLRDWNEEYQCCRELPTESLKDEIVRARVMYKIVTEFVEAATSGAVAIVEGNIPPINPMDDESTHVYVFNNIFFSVSNDGKPIKDAAQGDENAYSAANRDLVGVKAFNEVDVRGLHTLATTVVDYLGVRVIAQSLIPGILIGDSASKLVYGSVDHGKTIAANSKMHALMLEAGSKLHIAERTIKPLGKSEKDMAAEEEQKALGVAPESGEATTDPATICGAVEAKGIQGSDGRLYVLDLVRITPKDWTFYKSRHAVENTEEEKTIAPKVDGLGITRTDVGYVALLRPELVQLYSLWKQNQARRAASEARKVANEAKEAEKENSGDTGVENIDDAALEKKDETVSEKKNDPVSEIKEESVPEKKIDSVPEKENTKKSELKKENEDDIPPVLLNPNVFMEYAASLDPEQLKADEAAAKDAAEYLQKIVIPAFVADVRRGAIAPADGYALTQLMHSCGINMRYLGRLASLAKKLEAIGGISKYMLEMLEVEMISRVAKHVLADVFNSDNSIRAAPGSAIVNLLNGILGSISQKTNSLDTSVNGDATVATALSDPMTLWTRIGKEIKTRFDYELALWGPGNNESGGDDIAFPAGRVNKMVMMRRLCQRLGLRVESRNYNFSSSSPVSLDDMAGVVPVVKTSLPAHPLPQAKQLIERGRLHLSQGALSSAYEFLQEASSLLFQVCGAAHEDAALCSSSLATVLYHAGDVAGAIAQQQRALALYTQLQGIDYHDTAYAHANLALFLHANAQTDLAVPHIRRAIYLLEFCCGPHFPEISSLYFKMGMMCQDVGQISLALMCHRESLRRGEFDRNQAANTLHQMALACSLAGGYREALAYEKKVYSLFKEAFGDEDSRVVESAKFMAKFTEKAVEGARGRREVDAAAAADAVANQLLGEFEIKTEADQDSGPVSAPKKKTRKPKNAGKKH
uniref:Clu domain-containing protein n=1 Tax=Peronospora matthiolae TaxID=2874970 RepID=A0AAV1TDB8_9STRA